MLSAAPVLPVAEHCHLVVAQCNNNNTEPHQPAKWLLVIAVHEILLPCLQYHSNIVVYYTTFYCSRYRQIDVYVLEKLE